MTKRLWKDIQLCTFKKNVGTLRNNALFVLLKDTLNILVLMNVKQKEELFHIVYY